MTERDWVYVGKVTRPHGVRGELRVFEGLGSSGAWRRVEEVRIGAAPDSARPYRVVSVRGGGKFAILKLAGIADFEAAEALRDQNLYAPRDLLPATRDGEYYAVDLLGAQVYDEQDRLLGTLLEIFDNGAHEVYVIAGGPREILLPVIDGVIVAVDLPAGRIIVAPPEGLPGCGR